jgi:hypothetical protein
VELFRDFLLLGILAALLVTQTPQGQNFLDNTPNTQTGVINSIDTRLASVDSNTDQLRNLLETSTFEEEDFAQENTLSNVDSNTDNLEEYANGTEINTQNLQEQIDNIEELIGKDGRSTDGFGELVTKNTRNLLNLPSHNPYSRERWRVEINDVEENLMYNQLPEYTKQPDNHLLTPEQGQKVTLESTERAPYVVHFELWYSWAFSVNRTLETGDAMRIGAFDEENGYYLEKTGSHGKLEADLKILRNGSVVKTTPIELVRPVTEFTRFELRSNWYNAGEQTWIQTVTNSSLEDVQQQYVIGRSAPDGNRFLGPETPQLPIRFEIERGSSSSPLSMDAGSANVLVAGDVNPVSRVKTDYFTESVSQPGEWEPVAAVRIEPENSFVLAELTSVDMAETSASTDFFVSAQSHDPDYVLSESGDPIDTPGTGWDTPEPMSDTNSVVEFTTNISEAANANGTTVGSTVDPGGFQVGWGSLYSSGNKGSASSSAQQDQKRPIFGSDVIVFWVKADDEGNPSFPADATIEYVTEMTY